jgi:hypothetical protein
MRLRVLAVAAVLAVAGCGTPPQAAATTPTHGVSPEGTPSAAGSAPSPAPTPKASPAGLSEPAAVVVNLDAGATVDTISLVNLDGSLRSEVTSTKRTTIAVAGGHAVVLPYVSTSLTTAYFLRGDREVDRIGYDDSSSMVTSLPVSAGQEATFAVSPDDQRIAIGVLDFGRTPVHVSVYTDALAGGDRRLIFESDADYVWPVAWHAGLLVLAHASGPYLEDAQSAGGFGDPYSAVSYHLVDPDTGDRKVLMGQCTVSGPLSAAGTACLQGGTLGWDGTLREWGQGSWATASSAASLSPDGALVAATIPGSPTHLGFYRPDGTIATWIDGPDTLYWAGWIDSTHVVHPNGAGGNWVLDLNARGAVTRLNSYGFYAARLPTDVV